MMTLFGRIGIDYSDHYSAPKRIRIEYLVHPYYYVTLFLTITCPDSLRTTRHVIGNSFIIIIFNVFQYLSMLYDVDIEASACVLSSRYAMLCYAINIVIINS